MKNNGPQFTAKVTLEQLFYFFKINIGPKIQISQQKIKYILCRMQSNQF